VNFAGQVTKYEYNNQGQLTYKKFYANGSQSEPNMQYEFTYDALGRRTQVDINDLDQDKLLGTYKFYYDNEGRIYQVDSPQGYIRYSFSDITGRRMSIFTPEASGSDDETYYDKVEYGYDSLGRLATVTVKERAEQPFDETTGYHYDTVGSLSQVDLPNGNKSVYSYDILNRLTKLEQKDSVRTIASYEYSLADDGIRTAAVENVWNGSSYDTTNISWSYDALNRLITEDVNAPGDVNDFEHAYVYDLVGNRLQKQVTDGNDTVYSYDPAGDELEYEITDGNSTTYSYDLNGSLVAVLRDNEPDSYYTYNLVGRMASASDGTNAVTYRYNPDGIRVDANDGTMLTKFLIDPFNHTGYEQVLKTDNGTDVTFYTIGNDVISQAVNTADPMYFLYDGHGSVRHLADENGALISGQSFDYNAYGNRTDVSTAQTNLLYTGEWWDDYIGGYNLRTRDYRPDIGRFMTQDTYAGNMYDPQSLHKYLYCHANPVNAIDPSGQESLLSVTLAITIASFILMAPTWVNAPGHHDTPIPDQGGQMILDMGIALGITTGAMVVARFVVPQIRAAVSPWVRSLFNKIRFRNAMRVSSIESSLANSRRLLTGSTQLELNKAGGDAFEETVRASLRTTKGSSVVTSHGTVIPDLPVGNMYGVTDAKNVIKICQSPQTRGFDEIARAQNVPFSLIISPRTQTVSGPLQRAIKSTGGTIFEFDSASEIFKTVNFSGNKVLR